MPDGNFISGYEPDFLRDNHVEYLRGRNGEITTRVGSLEARRAMPEEFTPFSGMQGRAIPVNPYERREATVEVRAEPKFERFRTE